MATIHNITTADELLKYCDQLGRCELVRGELIMMSPAKSTHGIVTSTINALLYNHVSKRRLGRVFGGEAGFHIEHDPDTVRVPDVAFVAERRLKKEALESFYPGAPDLAVEVLSPSDRAREVRSKVAMWLATGCRLVWVVDPKKRTVVVHSPENEPKSLSDRDQISGANVLPGFRSPIGAFFADLDFDDA